MIAFWSILLKGPDTPKEMADSDRVRFSRQHINARCKTLVTYGLLVHLGNGVYDITQKGKQYLAGELDARDLEGANEPTPLEVLPTGRRMGCCPSSGGADHAQ